MKRLKDLSKNFCKDQSGATAVEYAIIIGLIAISIIGGATAIGQSVGTTLQGTSDTVGGTSPTP